MSYSKEFPSYVLTVAIPDGFEDISWHNDAMPSWAMTLSGEGAHTLDLILWVDYEDEADREMQGYKRFMLELVRDGCDIISAWNYHDYPDVLAAIGRLVAAHADTTVNPDGSISVDASGRRFNNPRSEVGL